MIAQFSNFTSIATCFAMGLVNFEQSDKLKQHYEAHPILITYNEILRK
jgi:hypothetical protein